MNIVCLCSFFNVEKMIVVLDVGFCDVLILV